MPPGTLVKTCGHWPTVRKGRSGHRKPEPPERGSVHASRRYKESRLVTVGFITSPLLGQRKHKFFQYYDTKITFLVSHSPLFTPQQSP